MKRFRCRCGGSVYFENHRCMACGRALAFDPAAVAMVAEAEVGAGLAFCANRGGEAYCNWVAPGGGKCLSCRTSRVIPALSKIVNRARWGKLEGAKRRLVYDLLALGLPVDPARLSFVFKEDRRTNPDVDEDHVAIGHRDGVITINAAEADEVWREEMRQRMNEPVRTLLGHFRHESGHYYFEPIVGGEAREAFRMLFGDERVDYDAALVRHYEVGPPADWRERYVSAYAAAHPAEDWAECWAHYLHIRAGLDTARAMGLQTAGPETNWRQRFVDLALALNEVARSLGLPDIYPFVITPAVAAKLAFVDAAVRRFTNRPGEP